MGKCKQLKLLIWKNFQIQKRHKLATVFEMGVPLLFALILVIIRNMVPKDEMCTKNPNKDFAGYCDYSLFTPALAPLVPPCKTIPCTLCVAYAPNTTKARKIMEGVGRYFMMNTTGFATEEEMVKMLMTYNHSGAVYSKYIGGAVFEDIDSDNIVYKLRLDAVPRLRDHSTPNVTDWRTRWIYPVFEMIGPREFNNSFGGDPGYFREGFLALQYAIDRFLLLDNKLLPKPIVLKRFPYPQFDLDSFIYILGNSMPFFFIISFIALCINCVRRVVHEKERRIKEAMKIMGLSGWVHWVAWYCEICLIMLVPVVLITLIMWAGQIFTYSDMSVIFLYIAMYVLSSISFSFMISAFFTRVNVATGASGVFWCLSYAPYFFITNLYDDMTLSGKFAASFLSNTAMGMGALVIARHESSQIGVKWSNFFTPSSTDPFTIGSVIGMLFVDTIFYIIITWYIENVFPGEFGIPRKWYFPLDPTYWGICTMDPLVNRIREETTPLISSSAGMKTDFYEEDPEELPLVIDIHNLTKKYPGATVNAVDHLNLKLYKGQIFVLLGHNGAGKTTTISLLTGLYEPTKGTALINGKDLRTNIDKIREVVGFCPQYNVLFDELTVDQHLVFFSHLKGGGPMVQFEVDQMIKALGLEDKVHELSRNLSGGMKRKLSCANALIGDSKIVFLDEPTSGMDPAARRSTWDLLFRYKTDKTIILTTHHMDEADLLGDRIGIMAKGSLSCVGSSMFLKKHFGIGYHMTLVKNDLYSEEHMKDFVSSNITGSKMEINVGAEVTFLLPEDQTCNFERFFSELERDQDRLGVETYGLSITTMEEVFIRVEEMEAAKAATEVMEKTRKNVSDLLKVRNDSTLSEPVIIEAKADVKRTRALQIRDHFNTGVRLQRQQLWAMLVKRFYYSVRNIKTLIMQFLMPLLFTLVPLIVIKTFPTEKADPALNLTAREMFSDSFVAFEPSNSIMYNNFLNNMTQYIRPGMQGLQNISDSPNMTWFALSKIKKLQGDFNKKYVFGVSAIQNSAYSQDIISIWFDNKAYHAIPVAMNLFTNTEMARIKKTVTTINHPLPPSTTDKVTSMNLQLFAFMVAFMVLFGFAFLASSFVVFVVAERTSGARHLQMLSGLNPALYWTSTFMWDIINFLFPSCLMLILFQLFGVSSFCNENLPVVLLLEMMYGFAILPLMYLLGRMFENEVVAYSRLIMVNVVTGLGAVFVVFILSVPALKLTYVNDYLKVAFLIMPNFDLGQGLADMYLNYETKKACNKDLTTRIMCIFIGAKWHDDPMAWDSPGIGRYLVVLPILGCIFFALVLALEYCGSRKRQSNSTLYTPNVNESEDVSNERKLVAHTPPSSYTVRVDSLTKQYNNNDKVLTAVDHLTIGIPPKETFGLLGVNGAGKTSTFRMLTGDLPMTSGTATICGYDISKDLNTARQFIGYCPQFDALIDCMTPREHVTMYARLRGVPEEALIAIVDRTINELSLGQHADYIASALSGGNKRKLSTAIALVGYPPVIFLDEPTSGLDVVARRALWDVICRVRKLGTAIILTSHSMEECEALCTRLAIMVNGQLKCIGTLQELKSRYGQGYNVVIKVKSSGPDASIDKSVLSGFMRMHFSDAKLEEEHQGVLNYIIPKSATVTWSKIFSLLENNKESANIKDYSVSQTTLEQVFLSFARAQRQEDV